MKTIKSKWIDHSREKFLVDCVPVFEISIYQNIILISFESSVNLFVLLIYKNKKFNE